MRPALAASALALTTSFGGGPAAPPRPAAHLRVNLAGYLPADRKVAVLFAERPLQGWFTVRPASSARLTIGPEVFHEWPGYLLEYLRQQRCGYNPFLDTVCHAFDGRTAYGPLRAGSHVDTRGGWHDAGDQLKYLITSSNATVQLLLAWRLRPSAFGDQFDALGRPGPNGDPDVLDEARWGLEWMLRLQPAPDQLYHQVADDRDHIGWKLPQDDEADYGWGKGRYRVVYAADGRPQGLGQYRSQATGVANLAGRYAGAMALAYQVWKDHSRYAPFAQRCLQAGREVYELGRQREGYQQGNSYGAPYRYSEDTWSDDMEWGAAELFKATGDRRYLDEAIRYARQIGATSMVGRDTAEHYQFYPFMNAGHFALHPLVDDGLKAGAGRLLPPEPRGRPAPRRQPTLWRGRALHLVLEQPGGGAGHPGPHVRAHDRRFALPAAGRGPARLAPRPQPVVDVDVHSRAGGRRVSRPSPPQRDQPQRSRRARRPGGRPGLRAHLREPQGRHPTGPDTFARFQGEAVYHDDVMDYSSNEPTMDGTASAALLFALLASP